MKLILGIILSSLMLIAGCGPFWVDPYIQVKESSLNWVAIHYYNLNRKPIRRITVEIYGNGSVIVKKGASELVSNDFAKRNKQKDWDKISTHRLMITPEEANAIFQHLVNYGVLDREKNGKSTDKKEVTRFLGVKANISNNTYSDSDNIFEVDPDLADVLLDVIREFENPSLR